MPKATRESSSKPSGRAKLDDRSSKRAAAFQRATQRKGMPMVWGVGQLRTDEAWRRDVAYRAEDAR